MHGGLRAVIAIANYGIRSRPKLMHEREANLLVSQGTHEFMMPQKRDPLSPAKRKLANMPEVSIDLSCCCLCGAREPRAQL